MLVCDCCWHLPEVQKASGQTNYEYVVSITDDPPICIFEIDKNNIDEILEVLNTLKKIIDYGHSIEFVRVLSIDGHWNDETDYLLEYKPCVEKANNDGTIKKSDYEFFNKLLKTSNCDSDMPLSVDHEVLQYIRLSY